MSSDRRAVVVGALVAASWANIALLDTWRGLFVSANLSWLGKQQSMEAFFTAVLVVLLAAAIGAMSAGVRDRVPLRVRQTIGDVGLLAAFFSIGAVLWRVNGGMLTTVDLRSLGVSGRVAAGLAGLLAIGVLAHHWRSCMRAVRGLLLLLAPFLVVTLGRASVAMSRADFTEVDRNVPSRGIAEPRAGPRVIIVVFDELDYTHAFPGRPADVHLPAFDQLRTQSVFATNVTPPADATEHSLPSYIAGESVTPAVVRRQYYRGFRDRGSPPPGAAPDQSTIFHDAAQLGAASELVGFYLPYCRWSFATLLERCTSLPFTWGGVFDGPVGIGASVVRQLLALAVVGNRMAQIDRIEEATAASIRAISDSSRRLIFLHLPVPHFPPVWDARHGRYTVSQFSEGAYFDNLALADSVLAQLLSAIDQSATAPPTFLIVTSDHPWRSGPIDGRVGGRIPFIVRAPSAEQIDVSSHVDAMRLRALTAQLLGGKLTTGRDVAEWLTSPATDEVLPRLSK